MLKEQQSEYSAHQAMEKATETIDILSLFVMLSKPILALVFNSLNMNVEDLLSSLNEVIKFHEMLPPLIAANYKISSSTLVQPPTYRMKPISKHYSQKVSF